MVGITAIEGNRVTTLDRPRVAEPTNAGSALVARATDASGKVDTAQLAR